MRITGAEAPLDIIQDNLCLAKNLVTRRNKFTKMRLAGKVILITADITIAFKPDFLII